jgi:hypothetical protein
MQTSSRIHHAKQRRSRKQQANTLAPPVWLQTIFETAALYVLPVTLLILLALIAFGIGNASAHLESGFSSPLAFELPISMGGAA